MDYDARFLATAARLLAPKSRGGKGQAVTLRQPAVTHYDTATGATVVDSPAQDHDGSGVELSYSAQSVAASQGLIQISDIRLLLAALKADGSAMPEPVADSWKVTLGGRDLSIKRVTPTRPAGVVILYELQLRV